MAKIQEEKTFSPVIRRKNAVRPSGYFPAPPLSVCSYRCIFKASLQFIQTKICDRPALFYQTFPVPGSPVLLFTQNQIFQKRTIAV